MVSFFAMALPLARTVKMTDSQEKSIYFFLRNLTASPIQRTKEVDPIMINQSFIVNGTVRNTSPPNCTISICPTRISRATIINPILCFILLKADLPVAKALALNIFQNCSKTKMVKNLDRSYLLISPVTSVKKNSRPIRIATNANPTNKMVERIGAVIMKSDDFRGLLFITFSFGGSDASAPAADATTTEPAAPAEEAPAGETPAV